MSSLTETATAILISLNKFNEELFEKKRDRWGEKPRFTILPVRETTLFACVLSRLIGIKPLQPIQNLAQGLHVTVSIIENIH